MNTNQLQEQDASCTITFEVAFSRLEEIIEKMNSGTISLDESLKLYEEADQLITICSKRLNEAERKVKIIEKNRNGEIIFGADEKPIMQDYKLSPTY